MKNDQPKDLAYYLTLFKLKGHETWRAHFSAHPNDFEEKERKNWTPGVVMTDKQVLRFDRITGVFSQPK